jgi:hypothetical protein
MDFGFNTRCVEGSNMLQTYQAELNGSQLIWLDEPPHAVTRERVLVVMERPALDGQDKAAVDHVRAFEQARGCLGSARREGVLQQLEQLRGDWDRNPIQVSGSNGGGRG